MRLKIILLIVVLFPSLGLSQVRYVQKFSSSARTFQDSTTGLYAKGLAFSCLTYDSSLHSFGCAPTQERKSKESLKFSFLGGNGYQLLDKISGILDDEMTESEFTDIFNENNILEAESNIILSFQGKRSELRLLLRSLKASFIVRNESYPVVKTDMQEETGLEYQYYFGKRGAWSFGSNFRAVKRKYLKDEFYLYSVIASGDELEPKEVNIIGLEPTAMYEFEDNLNTRLAFSLRNLNIYSGETENLDSSIQPQISLGLTPYNDWGKWSFELSYRSVDTEKNDLANSVHVSSIYHLGAMDLLAGIDNFGSSFGMLFDVENFHSGILFTTTRFPNGNPDYYTDTIYVQLGVNL